MNEIEASLMPEDIRKVERMGNRRITTVRAERRLPPQRPEFHGIQHEISEETASAIVNDALLAEHRWLKHDYAVLVNCLRDAGRANQDLRERAQDAEMWQERWLDSFLVTLAALLVVVLVGVWR